MRFPTTFLPPIHHRTTTIHHQKTRSKTQNPAKTAPHHAKKISEKCPESFLALKRLPGEVVQRKSKQAEHNNADQVVMQRIMFAETRDRALRRGFVKFHAHADQTDDTARSDKPRRIETSRRNLRLNSRVASSDGIEDRPPTGIRVGR